MRFDDESAIKQLFDALTPPDGSEGDLSAAANLAPHAWEEIQRLPARAKEEERARIRDLHEGMPVVPDGCSEAYLDVREAARTCKRSELMSPDWWINFCKHAWDDAVVD